MLGPIAYALVLVAPQWTWRRRRWRAGFIVHLAGGFGALLNEPDWRWAVLWLALIIAGGLLMWLPDDWWPRRRRKLAAAARRIGDFLASGLPVRPPLGAPS